MPYLKHFKRIIAIFGASVVVYLLSHGGMAEQVKSSVPEQVHEASRASQRPSRVPRQITLADVDYSQKLTQMGISLIPGTDHRSDSKPTPASSKKCESVVYNTLLSLPESHRKQLKELTLFYTQDGRRGLGGSGDIVLRCLNVTDEELASVLTHEMGHLVDGSLLTGNDIAHASGFHDFADPVLSDDPSLLFYRINWTSESKIKSGASKLDFVSGYAMTDPFEDFAETYAFYRLHGAEFRKLTESSAALDQKYQFMKNIVFGGEEFGTLQATSVTLAMNIFDRPYDVTVVPY